MPSALQQLRYFSLNIVMSCEVVNCGSDYDRSEEANHGTVTEKRDGRTFVLLSYICSHRRRWKRGDGGRVPPPKIFSEGTSTPPPPQKKSEEEEKWESKTKKKKEK